MRTLIDIFSILTHLYSKFSNVNCTTPTFQNTSYPPLTMTQILSIGQATNKYYCETRNPKLDFLLYSYEILLMVSKHSTSP